jgi:hypothetical protein
MSQYSLIVAILLTGRIQHHLNNQTLSDDFSTHLSSTFTANQHQERAMTCGRNR